MLFSSRAVDIPVTFYRNLHRLCGLSPPSLAKTA
jgi:hypothetical protein